MVYSIDKVRETTKNSGNIGIKESTRESVCRSVKDNELCTALLTMLLREDHFSNGSFERRFADGQVLPVLVRMKDVLSAGV